MNILVHPSFVDDDVTMEIPPELILNWGETGIKICAMLTMDDGRARRVEMIDKRQITAIFSEFWWAYLQREDKWMSTLL